MFEILTQELLDNINEWRKQQRLWTWAFNEDLQRLALAWAFWGRLREVKNLGHSPLEASFPKEFAENSKTAKVFGKICVKASKGEVLRHILEEQRDILLSPTVYQAGAALVFDGECWVYIVLLAR